MIGNFIGEVLQHSEIKIAAINASFAVFGFDVDEEGSSFIPSFDDDFAVLPYRIAHDAKKNSRSGVLRVG